MLLKRTGRTAGLERKGGEAGVDRTHYMPRRAIA